MSVKGGFVDIAGPLHAAAVPLDKSTGFTAVARLVEECPPCFVQGPSRQTSVFTVANQACMIGLRPDPVLLLEGSHDALALLLRGSRVKHTKPLLEVDTWAFVVLVVGQRVRHGLDKLEGEHVTGLVKGCSSGGVHGAHGLTGGKMFTLTRVGPHPRLGTAAVTFVA